MATAILDVTSSAPAEGWNGPAAYAQLRASARNVAGLDHARSLIRKARVIRYLRYRQLAEMEQMRPLTSPKNGQAQVEDTLDGLQY